MMELMLASIGATLMTIVAITCLLICRRQANKLKRVEYELEVALEGKGEIAKNQPLPKTLGGVSESTVLAIAGEISRMENNLAHMADVPGRKQLLKCVERTKACLMAENYNIVPLLGKMYTNGMMATALFVHNEQIPKGEARIISVQLPQVNYCGKMIQSAKVTVGENFE